MPPQQLGMDLPKGTNSTNYRKNVQIRDETAQVSIDALFSNTKANSRNGLILKQISMLAYPTSSSCHFLKEELRAELSTHLSEAFDHA